MFFLLWHHATTLDPSETLRCEGGGRENHGEKLGNVFLCASRAQGSCSGFQLS